MNFLTINRLLWNIMNEKIEWGTYSLRDPTWATSLRVVSFAFTVWNGDRRPTHEQYSKPELLEIAWSEADPKTLKAIPGKTICISLLNNKSMSQPGFLQPCSPGEAIEALKPEVVTSTIS